MPKTLNILTAQQNVVDPTSVEEYVNGANKGYSALKKAMGMKPADLIEEVKTAQLLGRGGAAFPAGLKWEQLFKMPTFPKYIVCNADEGEPGTFKDKLLLEKYPLSIIEGMTIAGYVFNAHDGYIYIRGEYRTIQRAFKKAIENAKKAGFLGKNINGSGFEFNIHVMTGAGAYVCGENSALLNSTEGKVGRPRIKPPRLAEVGLFLMPTLVNNVESFASVPVITNVGGQKFLSYGTPKSGGTKLVCLSGNVVKRGTHEIPIGKVSLKELIYDEEFGGGIKGGKKLKFFHLGGQSGPIGAVGQVDTLYGHETLWEASLNVGSGAIVVLDESVCVVDYLKGVTEFFIHESCGKCTPCREGNKQIYEILCKVSQGEATKDDLVLLKQLADMMVSASFCGLGQAAPVALNCALKLFASEFEDHLNKKCPAQVCFA
ncbi:MAG: NADH-quinone oxidoreductase subunit F [Sporomusaceae bacterium]|jgi:NADH-quinone oxidoreductase subunit F|nr:NADH-quinone oxidoreductase subunit F [Sporomusaceae bacterium]